jgi:hypothetical protein
MKTMALISAGLMFLCEWAAPVAAQDAAPPPESSVALRPAAELDQMLSPIALYPDPLIAEILPASTFPSQIVMADRYVSEGGDPDQIAQQPWDPSIQALAHYPTVLKWMDDNLPWTTQLGQAFATQQSDVMDAIQRLRGQAQNLGNLPSTPQESVVADGGDIEIEPVNPDDMYVPTYPPDTIYYQPGIYCTFGLSLPIGLWLGYDWNWHDRHLIAWGPDHPRPGNWWHESPGQRHSYLTQHSAPVWNHGGGTIVAHAGWERGYASPAAVAHAAPALPRSFAPSAQGSAAYRPNTRPYSPPPAIYTPPPAFNVSRSSASQPARGGGEPGAFGASQSAPEARESSSRGQSSRATISSGGGGGGGKKR